LFDLSVKTTAFSSFPFPWNFFSARSVVETLSLLNELSSHGGKAPPWTFSPSPGVFFVADFQEEVDVLPCDSCPSIASESRSRSRLEPLIKSLSVDPSQSLVNFLRMNVKSPPIGFH